MTITDARTQTASTVSRTYRTSDGEALLHITRDRKIWLDCTGGGPGRAAFVGTLPADEKITRANVRREANQ